MAEFLKRLTSVPLETEDVRTLARAQRASDKSFPRNEGRCGSNDGREEVENDHVCDGCGDEEEDSDRFRESDSSFSLSSSKVLREFTVPGETGGKMETVFSSE